MIDEPCVYEIIGDQPMTCPKCGCRTDWIELDAPFGQVQQHTCLGCKHEFYACEDDDEGEDEDE